jgi:hypothetical protein
MIKRVTVVHARSGTDRAEVLRYWKDVHGPLIAKVLALQPQFGSLLLVVCAVSMGLVPSTRQY